MKRQDRQDITQLDNQAHTTCTSRDPECTPGHQRDPSGDTARGEGKQLHKGQRSPGNHHASMLHFVQARADNVLVDVLRGVDVLVDEADGQDVGSRQR